MTALTGAILSMTIVFGAVIGRVRYHRIDPAFYPFIYLVWLGMVNETTSIALMYNDYPTIINNNCFVLIETILINWQFFRWNVFRKNKKLYQGIQAAIISLWAAEFFIFQRWESVASYFLTGQSFYIVVVSIGIINRITFNDNTPLIKHPVFLICLGFIAFFIYAALIEIFWLYGLNQSRSFRLNIMEILAYINLFTNTIYAIAILWMPMRQEYIMQSSSVVA